MNETPIGPEEAETGSCRHHRAQDVRHHLGDRRQLRQPAGRLAICSHHSLVLP
jgi:hypothetical protein